MKNTDLFIFGFHSTIEALRSGKSIEKIYIKKGLRRHLFAELHQLVKEQQVPFQVVPAVKLQKMAGSANHQGVIAHVSPITYQRLDQILPAIYERGEVPLLILLDGVTDVRNLGAIARTAEAAGVHALIIPTKGAAQIGPDAVKTSSGALQYLPVCRSSDLSHTIQYLKDSGLQVFSTADTPEHSVFEADFSVPLVILVGDEEKGVSRKHLQMADQTLRIPMYGHIQSLNVSAATSVMLYEAIRQRRE